MALKTIVLVQNVLLAFVTFDRVKWALCLVFFQFRDFEECITSIKGAVFLGEFASL